MMIVAAASPIRAAGQGAEIKFVGGVMDKEILTLITNPAIKSPADLKGTKLAIHRLGDYTEFLARAVFGKLNLTPEKDVSLIQIGRQTSRFAALKSGVVEATFVAPPLTSLAKQAGLNLLIDLATSGFLLLRLPSWFCEPRNNGAATKSIKYYWPWAKDSGSTNPIRKPRSRD